MLCQLNLLRQIVFQGNNKLLVGRFKGLDIVSHLFEGWFHLFVCPFFGVDFFVHSLSRIHTLCNKTGTVHGYILSEAKP